jgi:thiol:disulfide interchange protein DsbD
MDGPDARVEATLWVDHTTVAPGDAFRVGVTLAMDEGWHVYWRNPGQAAYGTEVVWSARDITVGALQWPVPRRFVEGGGLVTTWGYGDSVTLVADAQVSEFAEQGDTEVHAVADFLACRTECIPGRVELSRPLRVGDAAEPWDEGMAVLSGSLTRMPVEAPEGAARWSPPESWPRQQTVTLTLWVEGCPPEAPGCRLAPASTPALDSFFPERSRFWELQDVAWTPEAQGGGRLDVSLRTSADAPEGPLLLGGVWAWQDQVSGTTGAWELPWLWEAPVVGVDSPGALADTEAGPGEAPASGPPLPGLGLWTALWMALLGGLLLNLMPCVLPVLALKVFALASLGAHETRQARWHALAYTLGVVGSMWALAAVMLGLRSLGSAVGWGMQFQQPGYVLVLLLVVVLFGLNLLGVFEVKIDATGLDAAARRGEGALRPLFEGVLTVVLATPCSAPLMGPAMGFALVAPSWLLVAIFTALGVGIALPWLLLALVPGLRRWMPRPGAWMERVRQGLGFVLLAVGAWLFWLLAVSAGASAVAGGTVVLLAGGLAGWLVGEAQRAGRSPWPMLAVGSAVLAAALVWGWPQPTAPPGAGSATNADAREGAASHDDAWSEARVQALLTAGRPVLVDFTASWCITCQVNERTVLQHSTVQQVMQETGTALLVGDWTHGDEAITAMLRRHGRAGVPMYLVYHPEAPGSPRVLPEVLTVSLVTEALRRPTP